MGTIEEADIRAGLDVLGLRKRRIVVHASLKSFGHVVGGADTVIRGLVDICDTVAMPAFISDAHVCPPPDDRPGQNGCDYSFYDTWVEPQGPFNLAAARINPKMGAIAMTFAAQPGTLRSGHPWHSWAACGAGADSLVADHAWDRPNLPLERLAQREGWVLLLGVGLTSCTAVHLAEERAGRRPFIRWARDHAGRIQRIRVAGCAKGFGAVEPHVVDLFREARVGACRMRAAHLDLLLERCTAIIRRSPDITRCSAECLRCRDAIQGGPPTSDRHENRL